MITPEMRTAIRTLKAQGASLRQIAQDLKISRNAVRRALRAPDGAPVVRRLPVDRIPPDLGATLERARGNAMRVRELLAADGTHVSYSTLTRWLREAGLRAPPARAGEYVFAPGCEMQHDTSRLTRSQREAAGALDSGRSTVRCIEGCLRSRPEHASLPRATPAPISIRVLLSTGA